MENKVISFHGKQEIKDQYLTRLKQHYELDEIIKGKYWENGKGCAVGCTVHSSSHDAYVTELGITWRLALIEDSLFENLPNDQSKEFPIQFLEAVPVGIDTDLVFKKFILWCLSDEKDGLINVVKDEKQKDILQRVANLYKESYTREIEQSEWEELVKEASYAYASAYAYAYAYAYASASASASAYASASASASTSAYASASTSAYAYAYAYASYGTDEFEKIRAARILLMRDKLIELLKEAK